MVICQRKTNRLKNFDYSDNGWYFITICTKDRECLFGNIVGANHDSPNLHHDIPIMELNGTGKIIENILESLPKRFPVVLDEFQIMPNHTHMIIQIVPKRAIHESPLRRSLLSQIIGYFKMNSTKMIHVTNPNIRVWQRNYYEHIVRNEYSLNRIREYIRDNTKNWEEDRNNIHS